MGYEPVGKLLLQFAVPSTISVLVNSVYNIVDQIFIGQGVGYLGNAATTVTFPIITIIMAFATLLGGSAYAAIKLGQKKEEEAEKTLNNNFMLSIITGIVLAMIGFIFMEPILRLFGATESIMPYAKDYASIILIGVPFSVIGPCLSNMARTDGSPRLSMYGILIGAILNTILDPIYIFIFHWGVKGADHLRTDPVSLLLQTEPDETASKRIKAGWLCLQKCDRTGHFLRHHPAGSLHHAGYDE